VELTKELPQEPQLTTRLYPVDYAALSDRLAGDLAAGYDYALHLGQAPRSGCIQLESIAINVAGRCGKEPFASLVSEGPVAYQSDLPLATWAEKLRYHGIPAQVSFHAGTFLCNAALYFSMHYAALKKLKTRAAFIHVPLETTQASAGLDDVASMPATMAAGAIRIILAELSEMSRV
jgi:pyroglutamyl-peptidase